jgi:alkanesulfonate monooxygenase SsuD/methylene tetrahydromethanopterin reductase-like flavin-dependent oxidoreductase (luciferase family)
MSTFGLDISPALEFGDPVTRARRAEDLGFDFISAYDHPCGQTPTNETWTMLTWIAARTERLRIATRVLGVPYRPPAIVAKMAETLDRLSGGRLVLGLGGGFSDAEFRAFGLPVPTPREKVDGMIDAIEIAHGLWREPAFTYTGTRYHTEAADLEPKPARPVPIWLGTYGDRALAATGRLADGWIPSLGAAPPERIPAMRERIFAAATKAGRSPEALTLVYNLPIRVDETAAPDTEKVTGPVDAVVEQLVGFTRLGFTGFNLQVSGPDREEQIERVATEVIPAVRSAVASQARLPQ